MVHRIIAACLEVIPGGLDRLARWQRRDRKLLKSTNHKLWNRMQVTHTSVFQ
jgi:hypothetical protein